jgi:sialate O-acetylesterase
MFRRSWIALALIACWAVPVAHADVKPHELFSSGMVLQRNTAAPIWGIALPNEKVTVTLDTGNKKVTEEATADAKGSWRVTLQTPDAGGPYTLRIDGAENSIELKHVLVGEVWIASGQSNMEWSVNAGETPDQIKSQASNPNLRLFTVRKTAAAKPQTSVPLGGLDGQWLECNEKTVGSFSAVAYHFGKHLQKALNVPVGIIHTSWGGTAAEEWTRMDILDANPQHKGKHPRQSQLYNGMIAPLIPYAFKGAIWYQGESNAGNLERADAYRELMALMIKNWRDDWKQGDFPFLLVQLAPFMKIDKEPADTPWAHLRESQLHVTQHVPKTGMAVITDVGNEKDIHPKPKEPVGERLALAARAIGYGEKVEYSGPLYDSMKVEGNKAILSFKHVGGGLEAKGGLLTGFTVAGEDKKFHNAQAEIQDDKIIITCDQVEKPVAVRFGWANYPVVNLWNKAGLPASPFRTDDWPGVAAPKK